jgi:hypothetical protein
MILLVNEIVRGYGPVKCENSSGELRIIHVTVSLKPFVKIYFTFVLFIARLADHILLSLLDLVSIYSEGYIY